MDWMIDTEDIERRAVKAALLLAKARYDAKYAKFVSGRAARLAYIEDEITRLAQECAAQTDANAMAVESFLRALIAEEVDKGDGKAQAVSEPESQSVTDGPARGEPYVHNTTEVEPPEGHAEMDIKSTDGVLNELENHDVRHDLNDDSGKFGGVVRAYAADQIGNAADASTWQSCFRCAKPLNPVIASTGPVCTSCNIVLSLATEEEAAESPEPELVSDEETPAPEEQAPAEPVVPAAGDPALSGGSRKALEIVSLEDGKIVETIPLAKDDPRYIERVTLGLLTQMDRDKFFLREIELPAPQGIDIGQEEEEFEAPAPMTPMPDRDAPVEPVEPVRAPEREPVRTHVGAELVDPNAQVRCSLCSFVGTLPQVQLHEQQTHPELRQQQPQPGQPSTPGMSTPGVPPQTTYAAEGEVEIRRQPGNKANPSSAFENNVQQMANYQAAATWSTPKPEDVEQIAQQYGIDPASVQGKLVCVAQFGNAISINGSDGGQPNLQGLVQLDHFGGRIPTSEEQVDVQSAMQTTAHELGIGEDDVQLALHDAYGDELGDKYFVSVSGEAHYYLPQDLVGGAQQPTEESPRPALQASVIASFDNLSDLLVWEKQASGD